jgi:hypothetical protein
MGWGWALGGVVGTYKRLAMAMEAEEEKEKNPRAHGWLKGWRATPDRTLALSLSQPRPLIAFDCESWVREGRYEQVPAYLCTSAPALYTSHLACLTLLR